MDRDIPPPLALTLLILLRRAGWNQEDLAAALRKKPETVSAWIRTGKGLTRKKLEEICRLIDFKVEEIDRTLDYLAGKRPGEDEEIPGYTDLTADERRLVREVRARVVQIALDSVDARLPKLIEQQRLARARAEAEVWWQALRSLPPEQQRSWIDQNPGCCTPAFVARVCAESVKTAAHKAARALALAQLALYIAERVPGGVRDKCKAHAKGFIANAHRVGGQLPVADAAYGEALRLWRASTACVFALDAARFLDLGASLRRDQRRLDEALALLDEALDLSEPEGLSDLLLNKSHVQHARGEYREALETLSQAAARIDPEREPRSWFAVQFNRAANLHGLGQHIEAQGLLPTIWDLVESFEGDLHLLRLRWLAAKITAGTGYAEAATRSLLEVQKEFEDLEIPFDTALVSLDLAEIYVQQGRWRETRFIAEEMIRLFQNLGVHREAMAALLLFREAVEREEATVGLIRRLAQYLREAEHDPSHHFDG